ncbi:phosphatidylcholine:ceramide cholinephosphotransferase 2 [Ditylenchus destructor]|nr:phosphatidylcholine:ceramide cholinephosphotransferase 2 [Ditylenchus destructor]
MKDRNGSTMKLLNGNVSKDKKRIYLKLLTKEEIIRRVESPDSEYKSIFKLALALLYFLLSTYLTCAVMVYVDGRTPDGYPPLPDLFLDNIPPVPYAFELCELIAVSMALCWTAVILLHKHRVVILRRTFSLIGSVFIIKCLTMIITSMSVPAHHLICDRNIKGSTSFIDLLQQSFQIWFRVGLTIFGGKRTCGDYMFSGHTATMTLLNHLITEYTPAEWKAFHITSWMMNIVGMFLILAAHEHYSVDVFIAFYISSRMFLYYHTYAYNHSKFTVTDWRVRLWFPLGWFFEAGGVGRVLNEYKFPWSMRGNSIIDAAQEFKQNGTLKNTSDPIVNIEPIMLVNSEANGNYRFQMKLLNKEELIKKVESPDTKRKSMIKLVSAFVYCEFVFLLTSIVMTFVDDRVPDVQKYPPLPDIVLSNIPLIPWACSFSTNIK